MWTPLSLIFRLSLSPQAPWGGRGPGNEATSGSIRTAMGPNLAQGSFLMWVRGYIHMLLLALFHTLAAKVRPGQKGGGAGSWEMSNQCRRGRSW